MSRRQFRRQSRRQDEKVFQAATHALVNRPGDSSIDPSHGSPVSTAPPGTADLYDQHGERLQSCNLPMTQYGGVKAFRGRIVTLLSGEDNLLLKGMIREPGDGRVLVVDALGSLRVAMIGDNMAAVAAANGWAGFVINGAVRDAAALRELPIGVKALATNPRRSLKNGAGARDVPVSFGDVIFRPGALLVSDDDGVVILPADS